MADSIHPRPIVALVPVRNEAYILPAFVRATKELVDHILIAVQSSRDGTEAFLESCDGIIVVENPDEEYDEGKRQRLMIAAARERFGDGAILIGIDADELFVPLGASIESIRERMQAAARGTTFFFPKPTPVSGWKEWSPPVPDYPLGVVDDGSKHEGDLIHNRRVPVGNGDSILLPECAFVHLDSVDPEVFEAKRAYYSVLECVDGSISLRTSWRRGYCRNFEPRTGEAVAIPISVFDWFQSLGIDLRGIRRDRPLWWDVDVLRAFKTLGARKFRWHGIWHRPWERILRDCQEKGIEGLPEKIERPPIWINLSREAGILLTKITCYLRNRLKRMSR